MARSIDKSFYSSKVWRDCKTEYLKKVNHQCERCRMNGLIVPAYIVHHKKHLNQANYEDASVALNFENLEALCLTCHNKEHFGSKKEARWKVGESGELKF